MAVTVLDLPAYVGQRSATFRFGLVNAVTGEVLEDLNPFANPPAQITHDTSRTIKRQLSMALGVTDTARVNVIQDRVLPYMVVGGVEYPLGRFMFSDDTELQFTSGSISTVQLLDEMYRIDQQIETAVAPANPNGYSGVTALIQNILNPLNVSYSIDPSNYTTNGTWAVGTNRGSVLEDLSIDGAYFSPWFDNDGRMRFITAFDPADALIDFDWDENLVVMRDGITKTSDMLTAPNRFIVISNSTSSADNAQLPIVGRYDVPDSAPWSIANRGYVVPKILERGSDSVVSAQAIAATLGQRSLVFERYSLSTAPDPRHDSYDVIQWQGAKWLELAWSLTCKEGEPMQHVLRKAFS